MPIVIETEDGQSIGQRQPGLETANMRSVPQRLQTLPQRPPGQPMSGRHMGYGGGSGVQGGYQPMKTGFGGGRTGAYDPNDWVGAPRGLRGQQRLGAGIFGGRNAGPANDTVSAILGGMGRVQEPGFDVAGKTTDDRVSEKLWGKAVNSFPPGTPDMIIQQEWERLKKIYFDSTYGTPTLPGRDDIVGMG